MNPFAARLLQRVYAATAEAAGDNLPDDPEPVTREVACQPPPRLGVEPAYVTAFEARFRARAADEARVLERLAVETDARGSWEAARTLFAPTTPPAGLYAAQDASQGLPGVVVPPEAHKPTQPLPAPSP